MQSNEGRRGECEIGGAPWVSCCDRRGEGGLGRGGYWEEGKRGLEVKRGRRKEYGGRLGWCGGRTGRRGVEGVLGGGGGGGTHGERFREEEGGRGAESR